MGWGQRSVLGCALALQVGCASVGAVAPRPVASPALAQLTPAPEVVPKPEPPHPVIEAYIASLSGVLSEAEKAELAAIPLDGTNVGDSQRLRYLAADRAVRVFLPAALEASRHPVMRDYARRIRELPPLLNPDTDAVAQELVVNALRARARLEQGEALSFESDAAEVERRRQELAQRSAPASGGAPAAGASATPVAAQIAPSVAAPVLDAAPPLEAQSTPLTQDASAPIVPTSAVSQLRAVDDGAATDYADALAEYSDTYAAVFGVSKLHADAAAAAAADAGDAAVVLTEAIARGADRELLVREGIALVQHLAEAARRRERVPLPKLDPAPPREP